MNGELLKQVKEIFKDIVTPHIENIKEDIREIKTEVKLITTSVTSNKISVEKNKVNLSNITKSFRNYIILATFILSAIAFAINIIPKIIK